jgi:hypothetical protein
MARVVRPGGLAAAYVWDIVSGGGPSEAVTIQMRDMGFAPPHAPRAEASTPEGLHSLWIQAGFVDLEARVVRARRTFGPKLATMTPANVSQLKSRVSEQVAVEASGRVRIEARANAIVGRRRR